MASMIDSGEDSRAVRPRALVFDLYGEYFHQTGGAVKLGPLTELMGAFGIEPGTVRVVMTRLRKDGWFDSTKTGREVTYLLNERSTSLLRQGHSRIFERETGAWDRRWTQALTNDAAHDPQRRRRIHRALAWWGLGEYVSGSWFSPHDREKQVREMLSGEDDDLVFLRSHCDDETGARRIAERCWDLRELAADYHMFIDELRPRLRGYRRGLTGRAALIESMNLVNRYRHYPFRDPDLPELLLPPDWPGREAHRLFTDCHDSLREPAQAHAGDGAASG